MSNTATNGHIHMTAPRPLERISEKNIMKIDFHSHILPGIDDGSKDIEESIQLLDNMAADGVDLVVATPHFYCTNTTIHKFLERRDNAYEKLKPHLKPEHPRILLGGEILYHHALVGNEDIEKLTMQGTGFMLLEMPYTKIDEKIIRGVESMIEDQGLKIIVAHIERYLEYTSYKSLCELMDLDVLGQINAESLIHFKPRHRCFKLIKDGYVQVMGTDMHRIEREYPSLGEGIAIVEKKFGKECISDMERNGMAILKDRSYASIVG